MTLRVGLLAAAWAVTCTLSACGGTVSTTEDTADAAAPCPSGTVLTIDVPGDCHATVCDGAGGTRSAVATSNTPSPGNACLLGTCSADGTPGTVPAPRGAACTSPMGGTKCDGSGACVQCLTSTDCPVGLTCSSSTCVSSECTDGIKDGSETDVDCGGGTCPPCHVGQDCKVASDCASSACDTFSETCATSTCDDQERDGNETDIDCGGGSCPACGDGKTCMQPSDCASSICSAVSRVCVASMCNDQREDGAETDVDCGGEACPGCADGKRCLEGSDCASMFCGATTHLCYASSCSDGVLDGAETDVDCGGPDCSGCALGDKCDQNSDCASNGCQAESITQRVCITPTCTDGEKDGSETDVDCGGGTCPACPALDECLVNADCQSLDCDEPIRNQCLPATCTNGVKDGDETDVDCGGICKQCPVGDGCGLDGDCVSNACDGIGSVCVANQCTDHRQDGLETDVDCGGMNGCARCPVGERCNLTSDCVPPATCTVASPHVCE